MARKRVADMTPEERERNKARALAYHVAHREKRLARMAVWRAANPENPENKRAIGAAYRAKNRDILRAKARAYYTANPERQRARRAANPEKCARRRALKRQAPVIEKINRIAIFTRDAGKCHVCRRKVDPSRWHLDHLIPLAKGGEHAAFNVAVSHPKCNMSKGAKRVPVQVPLAL